MKTPRLLLRLRGELSRRLLTKPGSEPAVPPPADQEWNEMLARLQELDERERRLEAAERALNRFS